MLAQKKKKINNKVCYLTIWAFSVFEFLINSNSNSNALQNKRAASATTLATCLSFCFKSLQAATQQQVLLRKQKLQKTIITIIEKCIIIRKKAKKGRNTCSCECQKV